MVRARWCWPPLVLRPDLPHRWRCREGSLSTGGGWTLLTVAWLLLAAGASLWAGRNVVAAMIGVIAAVGAMMFALAVVVASFGSIGEQDSLNGLAGLSFGIGLPLLAGGLGLVLASAIRAIARDEAA